MSSFAGITFGERGGGNGQGFPVWSQVGTVVIKHIPGSDDNVIQVIGGALPRMAMPVKVTGAALAALQAAIGAEDTLIFHFETTTALLESVTDVQQFRTSDVYFATLSFYRSSTTFTTPATSILLEDGTPILLEDGTFLLLE